MAEKKKYRLRITAECKDRQEVQHVASLLLNRMGSHLTAMGMGKKLVSANVRPLDEEYFDHQESMQVVGRTLHEIMPKQVKWTLTLWHKRSRKGGTK